MADGVLSSRSNETARSTYAGVIKYWPIFIGACLLILFVLIFQFRNTNNNKIAAEQGRTGSDLYKKGDFKAAIPKLETSVKLNPNDSSTQRTLAQTYEAVGKLDKGEKAYQDSLAVNPNQPEVLYNLAIIHKSQGNTKSAVTELKEAIALNKKFIAARLILGDLYMQQNQKNKARAQYQTVIDLKPFGVDLQSIKAKMESD